MSDFLTQSAWAERLGVSIRTFRRWRAAGLIPPPDCAVPGYPRWSLRLVAKTTLVVKVAKRGLFQRGFQSRAARFQQGKGALNGAGITGEAGGEGAVRHAASVEQGADTTHYKRVSGTFR